MKIHKAYQVLNDAWLDWAGFLMNPVFKLDANKNCISWANYESNMLEYPVLDYHVQKLIEKQQYSLQVKDESIIQIYYKYDRKNEILTDACLAFYSAHAAKNKEIDSLDDEILLTEQINDSLEEEVLPFSSEEPINWLRIDYAPQQTKGIIHHECHVNTNSFPYSRLPLAGIPNPRQFIELVVFLFYPEIYNQRVDENGMCSDQNRLKNVNEDCFPYDDHEVYHQIAHLRIPDGTNFVPAATPPVSRNNNRRR